MRYPLTLTVRLLVCGLIACGFATASIAAETASVLAPFVNDNTFAVAHLKLASLKIPDDGGPIAALLPSFAVEPKTRQLVMQSISAGLNSLQLAGVEDLYAVAGLGDVAENCGPLVILQLKNGADSGAVQNMVVQVLKVLDSLNSVLPKCTAKLRGLQTIVVGAEATIARYDSLQAAKRDDLTDSLQKLNDGGAELAAVFSPGPDFRRVVRELWPALPPPLTPLKGELADRWQRLDFAVKLQPTPTANLTLQATDDASAAVFAKLWHDLPQAAREISELGAKREELSRVLQTIVDALPPKLDGSRVVLQLPSESLKLTQLQTMISNAGDAALTSSRFRQRMTQFKDIGLAMLNYESAKKVLPAAALRDKDGKPLLSWRVAVLPFLGEDALYKQFHLDEPWDSPHNRPLVEKMPDIFTDPDPKIRTEAGTGKTTYVVPVGPGTAFEGPQGIRLKDFNDGLSHTVWTVEVPPANAVIWTEPDDWNVDLQNPLQGIARTDRRQFATGYADGHVTLTPTDVKPDVLRALLTRAGGEVVDQP